MNLSFWKMSGAGNDFVCLDNRSGKLRLTRRQIARLCDRRFGIGADGLLVAEKDVPKAKAPAADFRMRYYNADGGEAEMCGNGARCFARYVQRIARWKRAAMSFRSKAGIIGAEFVGEQVCVTLTPPTDHASPRKLRTKAGGSPEVHFINTGVPHAVAFLPDLEKVPVRELGAELRYHKAFAPKGTNVNFVQILSKGRIRVRTYERGVEDETLACGTGVTACAIITSLTQGWNPPIRVRVQSGEWLVVHFNHQEPGSASRIGDVTLLGPATFTYKGEIHV